MQKLQIIEIEYLLELKAQTICSNFFVGVFFLYSFQYSVLPKKLFHLLNVSELNFGHLLMYVLLQRILKNYPDWLTLKIWR